VPEPEGGAHTDYDAAAQLLATSLEASLSELEGASGDDLRRRRRDRYRALGVFADVVAEPQRA
jgi:acetyl-CoA carboxylase carboxyl transferase subunit alpha